MVFMMKILLIAAGGGLGAVLRYGISGWAPGILPWKTFPVGTLVVNVLGCFLIGWLATRYGEGSSFTLKPEYRMAILVGLLGGFTTFSSFGYETMALLHDGEKGLAALNIILNNGLGLAACWLGYVLSSSGTPASV